MICLREVEENRYRNKLWCQSCLAAYDEANAGTCKECYEEASETEEELKREIEDLKAKVSFLRLCFPGDPHISPSASSADLLLHAVSDSNECPAVPAHRAVLISRSPVFKAMLEAEMEESRSGIIKIYEVSHDVLRTFVHYLYTAEVVLDEQMAFDLLILAEKYQIFGCLRTRRGQFFRAAINVTF
ncbi:hypothetical protein HPP92_002717 [Vanilla planifolia]|uniref:BTB domain-containing protein n=1 Tax=Vanilla planifolia TaxID=51239 RepID=A0A835S164_VANPL|nr:hypothetical protein HPP92_003126 [Vanilla planifolia]KAG0502645.1 hypothetical protein HPP92_002717 [Vanilla planifolia]